MNKPEEKDGDRWLPGELSRRRLLGALTLTAGGLLLPPGLALAKGINRTPQPVAPAAPPEPPGPPANITGVRLWTAPDHTRIVFELDRPVEHNLLRLKDPDRLVLDITSADLRTNLGGLALPDPVVSRIRTSTPQPHTVRAVIDLARSECRPRSFLLKAAADKGPRLVLDLHHKEPEEERPRDSAANAPAAKERRPGSGSAVIVVDPGHGGEDPGAIGPRGTYEKHVALAVARKLVQRLNDTKGFRAHITRAGDYYIPLQGRVAIARRHQPDLFISLHADAFQKRSVRGASVYCLSERGKPSPDQAINNLVMRENNADLIGGVALDEVHDREVAGILMDLAQRDSINRALGLGENLLRSLSGITTLKYRQVMQAGFAVLKAPDMPSVLVEMAFLSNPEEEQKLIRDEHQHRLADALLRGTREFLSKSQQA